MKYYCITVEKGTDYKKAEFSTLKKAKKHIKHTLKNVKNLANEYDGYVIYGDITKYD